MIRRAKAYIAGHYGDPVDLGEIARVMHVSTFYFCKNSPLLGRSWPTCGVSQKEGLFKAHLDSEANGEEGQRKEKLRQERRRE